MKTLFTFLIIINCFSFINAQSVFIDVSTTSGILPNTQNEGISVGDFNNDGYDDFYACSPHNVNQLYKNNGDGTFTEVGAELGVALSENINTVAAVWGDIDNDGWLDLYVSNKSDADQLFYNNGNLDGSGQVTFTEISFDAGIYHQGYPKAVNMADINNDGFLDIYISNFQLENVMYLNNGDLTFSNNTFISRALDTDAAMGTIFFDYDKDGDVDIYLVHDSYDPNFLYQNDGNGVFTEVGVSAGVNTTSFGMGVDVGDVNHDGWLDIYIANLGSNFLLLNNGDGTFSDISDSSGTDNFGMGWGTIFLDYDNDSWEDIYVANLYQFSPHKNILYRNKGDLTFEIVEENDAISNMLGSYGTVSFDYNLDGQIDVLVAHRNASESLQLFKNPDRQNHWISIKLVGTTSNYNAIGSKIQLTDNLGTLHYQELSAGLSWLSQNSNLMHFGLGDATEITEAKIIWASGLEETINLGEVDKFYTVFENEAVRDGIVFENIEPEPPVIPTDIEALTIVPNPNDGSFEIQFYSELEINTSIEIYNSTGQILYQKDINATEGNNFVPIDLSTFGINNQSIFIRVANDDNVEIQRCLIRD